MMGEYSGYLSGTYVKIKSDLDIHGLYLLQKLENDHNIKIKKTRCDSARENKKLKQAYSEKNVIKLEFTVVNTPQQNGKIERSFIVTL